MHKQLVEHQIKMLPFGFKAIYAERTVNNIYFDSPNFNNYYDNHYGRSKRRKIRIRWYGDTFSLIKNPILEVKIKSGLVGSKLSFPLKSFDMRGNKITNNELQQVFAESDLPEDILFEVSSQLPTLINSYQRKYLASRDQLFRFTIDNKLKYFKVDNFKATNIVSLRNQKLIIIELKYDEIHDAKGKEIGNKLPFRLDKFSKYVNGVDALHDYLTV